MISSWRLAGSSSRFVDGSGWSCSPLSFLFLSRLCAHITPAGAGPVMDSFILSSFSWPPPIVRYHRPVPLPHILSVDRRPSCFPCWLAFPAQHGYLVRSVRTPSLCPTPELFCPSCRFFFLSWFLLRGWLAVDAPYDIN